MDTCLLFSFTFLVFIVNSFTLSSSATLFDSTTDQEALLAFKGTITSDPNGVLSNNWSSNTSTCYWTGVSCGLKHRRVTALNLSGLALGGNLAPHLGNLTFLQSFDISSNDFTGSLPSELSKLRRLEEINVGYNNFTGEIPSWLGALSQLQHLNLNHNKFSGGIPLPLFNISRLQTLNLGYNQFEGQIPAGMYKCTKLEELRLDMNKLSGKIPIEIGNLTMLRILSLPSNHLEGVIPSSIFNISFLEYVDFYNNSLSGNIPIFYMSTKLEELYLNLNYFTGSIPKEIGYFNTLKHLKLSENHLTGPIPKQLGNLTSLIWLEFAYNKLTGELPEEIGSLANLEVFAAPFNDLLNGSIPSSIFNISTLKKLALQQNQFSGTLPSTMGNSLVNLEELYLFYNKLSGEIPTSITNASMLTIIELNRNSFTGCIPDFGNLRLLQTLRLWGNNLTGAESPDQELRFLSWLTKCRDLKHLEISDNPEMNGILPAASIGNLSSSLITFSASNCSIRGVIPSEIGNLSSLQTLDLSKNHLAGIIPTTLGNLKQVVKLYLDFNQLQGYIPRGLCHITNLGYLYLTSNMVTSSIPECLGEIKSLREVSFAFNKLNSTLPSDLFNLDGLIYLDLSSNYLSGQLPDEIGNLRAINELNLSSNKFSGNIPTSIDGCESLELLYLSDNMFNGSIPQSLGEIRGLRALDLSNNSLSGVIPESFVNLKLENFNVSYNNLEGEIPDKGSFRNFTAESFHHNSALCGATRFQVPPCGEARSRSLWQVMKYIVPAFIVVMILVFCIIFLIRRRTQKNPPPPSDEIPGVGWKRVSEREIKQGTNCFSETNVLGRGHISSVFKATLADGTDVAVKVFNLQLQGATKSFETESRILSTVRHRNLVRILGCCSNIEFKALILAYMPKGSLDKWLHSNNYCLDLVQRLKIAIDVALALEYLHHDHTFTVVHRDIKPSNVLLDEDMTARVGDFGVSKLFDNGEAVVHTINMATIGYASPEFGSEGIVSTSGDVYSYGILLLEIFTSQKPTDEMFNGEMSIKEWVGKALQKDVISKIVAHALLSREEPHFSTKLKCVTSIFELAMKCLAFLAQERINMKQVVAALYKINPNFQYKRSRRSFASN